MPFNGSGTFTRVHDWTTDRDNTVKITASRMDAEDDGFATGLSNCITKDGQQTITANIPFSTFKITGLGDPTSAQDAATKEYVDNGTATLANKTLTLPQINDTSADHQYIIAVSELAADRTVTLPLLTGNDTFTFNSFAATLTNKTVALGLNTISGTTAEFNSALSDGNFATQDGTETLTNKTLTSPTVNGATMTGTVTVSDTFALSGVVTPSQITADQNNYNPSGLSGAVQLRLSTDASRTITGLQGGAAGRLIVITNVGSNDLVLADESASSTAANRFLFSDNADLTLGADESAMFRYDNTSSRWRMVDDRASATASGRVFIESQDFSGGSSADFTGFDSASYDAYEFVLMNVVPAADGGVFRMRTSTDGGSTYESGTSDYAWFRRQDTFAVSPTETVAGDDADAQLELATAVGSAATEGGVSGTVMVLGPHLTQHTYIHGELSFEDNGGAYQGATFKGVRRAEADVDAVQFYYNGTNLESGTITMYGLVNQ